MLAKVELHLAVSTPLLGCNESESRALLPPTQYAVIRVSSGAQLTGQPLMEQDVEVTVRIGLTRGATEAASAKLALPAPSPCRAPLLATR